MFFVLPLLVSAYGGFFGVWGYVRQIFDSEAKRAKRGLAYYTTSQSVDVQNREDSEWLGEGKTEGGTYPARYNAILGIRW